MTYVLTEADKKAIADYEAAMRTWQGCVMLERDRVMRDAAYHKMITASKPYVALLSAYPDEVYQYRIEETNRALAEKQSLGEAQFAAGRAQVRREREAEKDHYRIIFPDEQAKRFRAKDYEDQYDMNRDENRQVLNQNTGVALVALVVAIAAIIYTGVILFG